MNANDPIQFPPVEQADKEGLLCYGGKLDVAHLVSAYQQGIFPWPSPEIELPLWFSPDPRGVIPVMEFKMSSSFVKWRKKNPYTVTYNKSFNLIIEHCAQIHGANGETWITPDMIQGYTQLFLQGKAYSVEVWEGVALVGGLYGVCLGTFYSAESMFYTKSNASKLALASILEKLKLASIPYLDTQMITPTVETFGGRYMTRSEFMQYLKTCNFNASRSLIIY